MQIMSNLPASYSYQQRQNNNVQFGMKNVLGRIFSTSKEKRIASGVQSNLPAAIERCKKTYEKFGEQVEKDVYQTTKEVSSDVTEQTASVPKNNCPPLKRNRFGVDDSDFTKEILDAKKNNTLRDGQTDTTIPSGVYGKNQVAEEKSSQPTTEAAKRFEERRKIDWIN